MRTLIPNPQRMSISYFDLPRYRFGIYPLAQEQGRRARPFCIPNCRQLVRSVLMEWRARIACAWIMLREQHRATVERSRPMSKVRFVGLDVHSETIAAAAAEPGGEVRSLGILPNRPESVRKLIRMLGPSEQLRVCYEAGPTGYVLYWQLVSLGVKCVVVAPTLIPVNKRRTLTCFVRQAFRGPTRELSTRQLPTDDAHADNQTRESWSDQPSR
jgi:hypothetical protein